MAALVPAIMVPSNSSSTAVLEKQASSSSPQQLDELFTLLRAESSWTKQRALAIIQQQSPEELYCFMKQLLGHYTRPRPAVLSCSSGKYHHALGTEDDTPDSPKRLAPATDQLLSPFRSSSAKQVNNTRSADAFPQQAEEEQDPQGANSPMQHQQEDEFQQDVQQSDSPVQQLRPDSGLQQLLQEPRGRFLAESLDLNLGASFDLLAKASLADFSAAAAAASRLSTTALVRQSHMRVLSPVAEASFMSATAGAAETLLLEEEEEQQYSADSIESSEQLHAGMLQQQGVYISSHQHQPQQQHLETDTFSTAALATAAAGDADLCLSTCSSPREPTAAVTGAATAAVLRMSVAESANGWPSSQPLPFMAQDMLEAEAAADAHEPDAQTCMHTAAQAAATAAAAAAAAAALRTPGAAFQPAAQPGVTPLSMQRTGLGSTGPSTPSAGGSTSSNSGAPTVTNTSTHTRRTGGGPNPLGLIAAPIHGANALRRSITRLWSGSKAASNSNKAKAPPAARTAAQPAPSSKQGPARTLACTSAPIATVYGGGPSFRQSPFPALRQPMQGFGITQKGSSPTKAAAAAVAASAAGASARTPQRAAGSGNIGYRPPSSAGQGTPTGTTPGFTAAAATGSRIPGGGTSSSSSYARAGSTPPSIGRQQQQQRAQLSHLPHHHHHDRPSSQASSISYARSDASLTGTGSHTSVGPFQGGFSATRQALQGKATPTLKQPASRLQHKQQQQQAASRGPGAGAAAAQGVGGTSRGGRQLDGGGAPASGIPRFSRQVPSSPAVGRQQQGSSSAFSAAASSRGLLAAGAAHGGSGGGGSRIGTGCRSGLRRSRSCGSLAEMLNVSELRSMWKQREQDITPRHPPATAAKHGLRQGGAAAGAAAGQALHAQSSIGRGTSSGRRQQLRSAARPTSVYQAPGRALPPAAAAAAGRCAAADDDDEEAGLPMLSRCQSPTRSHGQDRTAGVGASSAVLAEMGQVLSRMDTLIAGGDTAATAAAGPAAHSGGSSSSGRGLEPGMHQPGAVGGVAQSPSALVFKLVKGAASTAAAAATTPAADNRAGHAAAAGLGHSTQQMLLTPPELGATSSSQVTQQGGGTPHWNVYSAPPAAVAWGTNVAASSSQEGQDLSRQLFS